MAVIQMRMAEEKVNRPVIQMKMAEEKLNMAEEKMNMAEIQPVYACDTNEDG